jgi:membrane fusion protein (multidrug efflux system)
MGNNVKTAGDPSSVGKAVRAKFSMVLAFGALFLVVGCDGETGNSGPAQPPSVVVATAFTKEIRSSAEFVGKVEAIDDVDLIARVGGFLDKKLVQDGAFVSRGDLLYQIEKAEYKAALASAEAELAKAKSELDLKNTELTRQQGLFQKGHVSKAKIDASTAARDQAKAGVLAAAASLEKAKLHLAYTDITAPFTGRLGRSTYSVGDVVGPTTQPLARLTRVAPVYVNFSVSERDILQAAERVGGAIRNLVGHDNSPDIYLRLANDKRFSETGRIVFIDTAVNARTGTLSVRGRFDNAAELLLPGQFVTVIIEQSKPVKKLLVPQAAIQRDQKGDFVLTVGPEQMVQQRYVTTGEQVETAFVIENGLQDGERVIVQGLQKVRPGVPVNAVLEGGKR